MTIKYSNLFVRHLNERIRPFPKLMRELQDSVTLFTLSPEDPSLKDHQLTGEKSEYRAFSVTDDIRVIYKIFKDLIIFYDIGPHDQVY